MELGFVDSGFRNPNVCYGTQGGSASVAHVSTSIYRILRVAAGSRPGHECSSERIYRMSGMSAKEDEGKSGCIVVLT
jgi:hypothetical protein